MRKSVLCSAKLVRVYNQTGGILVIAEERRSIIVEKLNDTGIVRASELKKIFGVSGETLRKDFEFLEKEGILKRIHGGARSNELLNASLAKNAFVPFDLRRSQNLNQKQQIAKCAAALVQEGNSVGLDSGTTSLEIAKILKRDFKTLTVVTNSIATAVELMSKRSFSVICTGGVLTYDEHSFVSELATVVLDRLNLDIMFLTTCGISDTAGITDQRIEEVLVHKKMASISKKVVVTADSSKFNAVSLVRVCNISDIDMIVTDSSINDEVYQTYKTGCGKEILIAPQQ